MTTAWEPCTAARLAPGDVVLLQVGARPLTVASVSPGAGGRVVVQWAQGRGRPSHPWGGPPHTVLWRARP